MLHALHATSLTFEKACSAEVNALLAAAIHGRGALAVAAEVGAVERREGSEREGRTLRDALMTLMTAIAEEDCDALCLKAHTEVDHQAEGDVRW